MTNDKPIDALEERLARAWRAGPAESGPDDSTWNDAVMREVRARAFSAPEDRPSATEPSSTWSPLERLVRNGFLTAAAAALAAAVFVIGRGLDPRDELARLIARDPGAILDLFLVL